MWKTIFFLPVLAFAQERFEVASIKPMASNDNRIMIQMQPGGRFVANGITGRLLIGLAYDVKNFQISGGPNWLTDERFEINAKAETEAQRIPQEQFRAMLRALLAERFALKVHEEQKEAPVYELQVSKGGPKLVESKDGANAQNRIRMGRGQFSANGASTAVLVQQLSQQLGRQVIDKTGLTGRYDIEIEWTPDPGHGGGLPGLPPPPGAAVSVDSSGPSIFTVLEEKLGLRLESAKGQVKSLVIDHVEKPTEN